MQRSLQLIAEQSLAFHEDIAQLWADLPEPVSHRSLAVFGFCAIVRQHAGSQLLLARAGYDISATTLVRPAFEALVRAVWCMGGAHDEWIEKFLSPNPDAISSDAETAMGPSVQRMLDQIEGHHPEWIRQTLVDLKASTWRAMHSYVHGGIRPFVQGLVGFREHEVAGVVMNANVMLCLATNAARMACGVASPQLPGLQKKFAACLPPKRP